MSENHIISEGIKYVSYIVMLVIGWFLRRHIEQTDIREAEQDHKIATLDKRLDNHDVSRADIKAQIANINLLLQKMDRNIDKLLDRK